MMNWDTGIAKLLKERENVANIGNVLGKVVNTNPLQISILDGNGVLEGEDLYIVEGLITRLLVGDEVLLIPAENSQIFFIINKCKKVGG